MAIKTRETTADGVTNKGAPLTNAELDNNFVELQQNKLEAADLVAADTSYDNTDSGLVASNVQSAIDEIQDKKLNITDLAANLVFYPTDAASDISTYFKLVTSTEDADYDSTAVNISTGTITTTAQFIAALASEAGILEGSTGVISITTVGNVRRTSGSQTADFYFEVYKRDSGGTETLMGTSNNTPEVAEDTYEQFYAACLITATTFTATDRVVFKYYGNNLGNPSGSAYSFQFGGSAPVRSNLPVPVNVVSHANDAEDIIVDTSNFNGLLSGADNDVQAALETLDDHNHDSDYATTAQGTNADTAYGWGDHASAGYLTSYTETDPVVGAIAGIVKADGAGNISAAVAGTDYVASETYSSASDLLTAIKTVDGTGSGLDADTLDGNEATAFYLASNPAGYTTNTGTVTSIAATVPTGLTVSGSPVTSNGTLAISLETGYAIPTTASQSNWDTAYGWGNHASAGYLTSYTETDPVVGAITGIVKANGAGTISAAVAGTDYIATETYSSASDLLTAIKTVDGTGSGLDADTLDGNEATAFYLASNPSGYTTNTGTVTSVAATVPTGLTVSGSPITSSGTLAISLDTGYAIPTTTSQTNWDTAYGWGDHSIVGYLIGISGQSIEDLSDVNTMTPSDGQLLTWDNDNNRWDAADAPVSLPDQSGNSGKYLTTDGTDASWAEIPVTYTYADGGSSSSTYDPDSTADFGSATSTYIPFLTIEGGTAQG